MHALISIEKKKNKTKNKTIEIFIRSLVQLNLVAKLQLKRRKFKVPYIYSKKYAMVLVKISSPVDRLVNFWEDAKV